MRLVVTGGSGFLGRRVVARATALGHDVVGLARSDQAGAALAARGATVVRGDLDDPTSVEDAMRAARADALVNLASLGFGHAETIVGAAEQGGPARAVFLSTTAIFTTLDVPSRRIRTAAEDTIRASGLDWTIVRPTMIYGGPDDRNMCRLLAALRRCPVLPLPGGGRGLHQPVHVEDLADLVLRAVGADVAVRRAYDVAGPTPLTLRAVVAAAAAAVGRRAYCVPVPMEPTRRLVAVYGRLASRPRVSAEQIARLVEDKACSIDGAVADLGYAPRSFTAGISVQAGLTGRRAPGADLPAARTDVGGCGDGDGGGDGHGHGHGARSHGPTRSAPPGRHVSPRGAQSTGDAGNNGDTQRAVSRGGAGLAARPDGPGRPAGPARAGERHVPVVHP